MSERTDIIMQDVFFSWTGKDKAIKDRIKKHLRDNGITCIDSEENCSGDYRIWSFESVGVGSIFLLILTPDTMKSQYVPAEVEVLKGFDDWRNRVVPVCVDQELYNTAWGLSESESAVFFPDKILTQEILDTILNKVISLLIQRQFSLYREEKNKRQMNIFSMLCRVKKQCPYEEMYINRSITEVDKNGEIVSVFTSPAEIICEDGVIFISGAAGSGKTHYMHQIESSLDSDSFMLSLPCSKAAMSDDDLFGLMFSEFKSICGNRSFYSEQNFRRLLSVKRLVLVLDGMDEVATDKGKLSLIEKVSRYYEANPDNTTLIITGRNSADGNLISLGGKETRRFMLNSLSEDEIIKLGTNMFLMFGSADKGDSFYLRIKDLADEIKTNPMLLSQLAFVYNEKGDIPNTVVGIYDSIFSIILSSEDKKELVKIPERYSDMIEHDIGKLLKRFSRARYQSLSNGERINSVQLFDEVVEELYGSADTKRAEFLVEYLEDRAILCEGEFYHKMFLEYFTAVSYYDEIFGARGRIKSPEKLSGIIDHYADSYWSAVIKLFLVKADSIIDETVTDEVYRAIVSEKGFNYDYTLLFDACRDLICRRETAQLTLVCDILMKSCNGIYPAYGPLFWYVPAYGLYKTALVAAKKLKADARAAALVRDVCFIFGFYTAESVGADVDAGEIFASASVSLTGVRRALCELFYMGETKTRCAEKVYPRCFSVAEARSFMKNGHGCFDRMKTAFNDELGLFGGDIPELNGEYIGFVSLPYRKTEAEGKLTEKSSRKISVLSLTPTSDTKIEYITFERTSVRVFYLPENAATLEEWYSAHMSLELLPQIVSKKLVYFPTDIRRIVIPKNISAMKQEYSILKDLKEVAFEEGVTSIPEGALLECTSIVSVYLPESLKVVEEGAFYDCTALKKIHFPDGLEKIEKFAFGSCESIESLILPNSLKKLSEGAFGYCKGLKKVTLPKNLIKIGKEAFVYCENLADIVLSENLEYIQESAFENCKSLKSVVLPEALKKIGESAFKNCEGLSEIKIPDGVNDIGESAFYACNNLKNVRLPKGLKTIPQSAFCSCTGIENVVFPQNLNCIESQAFFSCWGLKDISLPDSVTVIKEKAFGNSQFREIKLPRGLKEIDGNVFEFTKIERLVLPEGISFVPIVAIENCDSLGELVVPRDLLKTIEAKKYKFDIICLETGEKVDIASIGKATVSKKNEIPSRTYMDSDIEIINIPEHITVIGQEAFAGCEKLAKVDFPPKLKVIEKDAFLGCKNLERLDLPETLEVIGETAFMGCESLTEVVLPQSVKKIGKSAFFGCNSLKRLVLPDSMKEIDSGIVNYIYSLEEIVLPKNLKTIGNSAFFACKGLKKIEFPESVNTIGWNAFWGCSSLEEVVFPKMMKQIVSRAFENCTSLKNVIMPTAVKKMGGSTFAGCTSLKSAVLPIIPFEIPNRMFEGCTSLRTVVFQKTTTDIHSYAFRNCTSLSSMELPEHLLTIGPYSFEGCTSLFKADLPESLVVINDHAFAGCSSLIKAEIPHRVSYLGSGAFQGCKGLIKVTLPETLEEIEDEAFDGCSKLIILDIHGNIKKIGDRAFAGCKLTGTLNISANLQHIGEGAFRGCSFNSLVLPSTLHHVGDGAFADCSGLQSIKISLNFKDDIQRIFGDINPEIIEYI